MPRVPAALARIVVLTCVLVAACAATTASARPAAQKTAQKLAPIALGSFVPGAFESPQLMDQRTAQVGRAPATLMWYQDWTWPLISPARLDAIAARGSVPMITWEAWDSRAGKGQPQFALKRIVAGDFDAYLRKSAGDAAAWGRPLLLRFGHEMNGTWYPWGRGVNGNTPADFVAAWRHIVTIFRDAGATNVRWVWSPNVDYGGAAFSAYYPGDAWVDWAGLDGYNWGALHGSRGWQSLTAIFGSSYDVLSRLTRRPMMISETASNEVGGDKAAWIRSAFLTELPTRMPRIRAGIWFDVDKEADWRTASSPRALAAFRQVETSPSYAAGASQLLAVSATSARAAGARR